MTNNCPSCFRPYPQEYFVKIVGPPKEQIYNAYSAQSSDNSERLKESIKNFLVQTIDQMEDKYNTILQEKQNLFDQIQTQNKDMFSQLQKQIQQQQEIIDQLRQEQNNSIKYNQTMNSAVTVQHCPNSINKGTQYTPSSSQSNNASKSSIINTVDQLFQQKQSHVQDSQVTMATIQLVPSLQQSPALQPNISIPQQQNTQFTNQLATDIVAQIQNLQSQDQYNKSLQTSQFDKFDQYVTIKRYNDDMQYLTNKINNIEAKINEIQSGHTHTINQIQMNFNQLNVQIQHLTQSIFETQSQMQNTYKQYQQEKAKQNNQQLEQVFENMILSGQEPQQNQAQLQNYKQESTRSTNQSVPSKQSISANSNSQSGNPSTKTSQQLSKRNTLRDNYFGNTQKKSDVYEKRPMSQISIQQSTSTQREAQTVKSTLQIIAQMSEEQVSLAASVLKKQLKQTQNYGQNVQSTLKSGQSESKTEQQHISLQPLRFSNTLQSNSQQQKSQNSKIGQHQLEDIEVIEVSPKHQHSGQYHVSQQAQSSSKSQQSLKHSHDKIKNTNLIKKQEDNDSDRLIEIKSSSRSASLLVQDVQEIPKVEISSYISADGGVGQLNHDEAKIQPISDEEVISQLKRQSDCIVIQEATIQQQEDVQNDDLPNSKLAQSNTPVPIRQNDVEKQKLLVHSNNRPSTILEDGNMETPPPLKQSQHIKYIQEYNINRSQTIPHVFKNTVQEQLFVLSSTKPQNYQQVDDTKHNSNSGDKIPVQPFNQNVCESKEEKQESVFDNSAFRTHMLQNSNEKEQLEVIYAPQGPKVATPSALLVTHTDNLIKQAQEFLNKEEKILGDKKSTISVHFSEIDVPIK